MYIRTVIQCEDKTSFVFIIYFTTFFTNSYGDELTNIFSNEIVLFCVFINERSPAVNARRCDKKIFALVSLNGYIQAVIIFFGIRSTGRTQIRVAFSAGVKTEAVFTGATRVALALAARKSKLTVGRTKTRFFTRNGWNDKSNKHKLTSDKQIVDYLNENMDNLPHYRRIFSQDGYTDNEQCYVLLHLHTVPCEF